MEVHHHAHTPDSHRGRKKWTHYFWEFLMLFLAVFCGFMAENFREHKIEHMRAKQFAQSLLNDLSEDTLSLQTAINFGYKKIESIDSLLVQLDLPKSKWNTALIYKYQAPAGRVRPFGYSSGTYEQMKSSGSLRYFDQGLSDFLNQYAVQAAKTKAREDIHLHYAVNQLIPFLIQHFDSRGLIEIQNEKAPTHPLIIREIDDKIIPLWINYNVIVQNTQLRTVVEYEAMLVKARQVMRKLIEEYHLE